MAEVTANVHHLSVASGPPGSSSCIFQNCPEGFSPAPSTLSEAGPCLGPSPFPPDPVGSSLSWPISWVARMASEFHSTTYDHRPPHTLPSSPRLPTCPPPREGHQAALRCGDSVGTGPSSPDPNMGLRTDLPARQAPCSHRGVCLPPSPPPTQGPSLLLPLLHSPSLGSPPFPSCACTCLGQLRAGARADDCGGQRPAEGARLVPPAQPGSCSRRWP